VVAYRRDLPTRCVKGDGDSGERQLLEHPEQRELRANWPRAWAGRIRSAQGRTRGAGLISPWRERGTHEFITAVETRRWAPKRTYLLSSSPAKTSLVHTVLMATAPSSIAKKMGLIPEVGHGDSGTFSWVVTLPLCVTRRRKKWAGAPRLSRAPHDDSVGA